jgi:hypothetical protein
MTNVQSVSHGARVSSLIAGAAILLLLAACDAAPTAPAQTASPRAGHATQRDAEVPPDSTCRSGWILTDGKWVCPGI